MISEYWYERKEIPAEEKEKIKQLVKGDVVGTLNFGGAEHSLIKTDGASFKEIFCKNRNFLYKGDYTAPPDENDYTDSSNYVTDEGLAGFSITDSGWLVSLFSNYRTGGFAQAIKPYVVKDSYKLVCIVANTDEGNELVEVYKNVFGFRKYATTINDIDVMRRCYGDEFIDAFVSNNGTPFHVFMIGQNAVGTTTEIPAFEDYFEAEAFVDESVKLK